MHKTSTNQLFYLEDHITKENEKRQLVKKTEKSNITIDRQDRFERLCGEVKKHFDQDWEAENTSRNDTADQLLMTQKRAIIGCTKEVNYFQDKIKDYLKKNNLQNEWFPAWYEDLTSAIFHENWGLSGMAAWKNMPNSQSAKIIGEKIFFFDFKTGRLKLQDQKIPAERLRQLRQALLLRNPEKRINEDYIEVYMLDGTRIIIFDEPLAKEPVIVFRKYIVDNYTFEEQHRRGTIPEEIIPMLKAKTKIGYNINFIGAVRTGKTTFLQTWECYEDPELEGIQVETDPENPLHKLLPKSPNMELIADGDKLKKIRKMLVRGDADYLIMAEARDGIAMGIAVTAANLGTKRIKSTFHITDPSDFPYEAATEIVKEYGGDLYMTIIKVAKSYHYLYEFIQLKNKSQKRLNAIYELRFDNKTFEISLHKICKYNIKTDSWAFAYDIGEDKAEIGYLENVEAFQIYNNELKKLAEKYPMEGEHVIKPFYNKFLTR